ncbi:MAG: transferrin-binding protein-like solute binding protein, partial [Alphaproteobacteria bacterium]|nr:transferrin-binding protein-like solute binding protein [Alphaproteobacteria bacterium]
MRHLLFSMMTLLMFSITLTACGSSSSGSVASSNAGDNTDNNNDGGAGGAGGAGGNSDNLPDPFAPSDITVFNSLNTLDANALQPSMTDKDGNVVSYDSLTAVSEYTHENDYENEDQFLTVTLQGMSVGKNDSTDYERENTETLWADSDNLKIDRQIQLSRISTPAVKIQFSEYGHIWGVTTHLNGKDYVSDTDNITTNTETKFSASIADADEGATTLIEVDRSADFFGFDSDYMVYISWGLAKTADLSETNTENTASGYDNAGVMIAGIDTDNATLPSNGTIGFTGKGKGTYNSLGEDNVIASYNTIFDVTANVDFSARNLVVTTSNTACTGACEDITVADYLDFSTDALSFANDTNAISGAVTLDDTLTGTLDARFYGASAWEFGGTFALTDSNRYYYGAFGAKRDDVIDSVARNDDAIISPIMVTLPADVTPNIPVNPNTNLPYTAINQIANVFETIVMDGIAAYGDDSTSYTRLANVQWSDEQYDSERITSIARLDGAVASIGFNDKADMSEVTIYVNDNSYTATSSDSNSISFSGDMVAGAPADADNATINVERGTDWFGFNSEYMASISWHLDHQADLTDDNTALNDADYNIDGMMIAGIETEAGDIRQAGKTVFTGKGRGYFDSSSGSRLTTTFTMNTHVDFAQKTLSLETQDSKLCNNENFTGCVGNLGIDFETVKSISYLNDQNQISNNISGAVVGKLLIGLTGFVDARFYGENSNEFGGTFAMSDGVNQYYGAFGTKAGFVMISNTLATIYADTPVTFNANSLSGFDDANRNGTSDNALTANAVQITISNDNETQTIDEIIGAVAEIDYDTDGDFADSGFSFYFADKKYEVTAGTGDADTLEATTITSSDDDT